MVLVEIILLGSFYFMHNVGLTSTWIDKELIMLPKFLYDALPYIYIASGFIAAISIANTLAFISGAIFGLTALHVFQLRGKFAKYAAA